MLYVGALVVALVGVFIIVLGCQLSDVSLQTAEEGFFTLRRILVLLAGLLTVLYGTFVLLLPRRARSERNGFVVQQTDNGELRISIKAIENLVQKCIDMHSEISVVSMRIQNCREGVLVDLRISLANNISIPLAVAALQKQIKQYLLASSGIDVHEVRVSVETANTDSSDSPYIVQNEVPAVGHDEDAQKPAKRDKVPLHQRLFSHDRKDASEPEAPAAAEAPADAPAAEPPAEQEQTEPETAEQTKDDEA